MKYELTQPCALCPFRNDDKSLTVHPQRLKEFASGEFACHKTTELIEADDDGEGGGYTPTPESQHCAGLLIMLEHMQQPHQMMRIAERLGCYDAGKLKMKSPVYRSLREGVAACTKAEKARKGKR